MGDEMTVVLTPTARLARAEKLRLAMARRENGESAWVPPAVLAFSSWLNQLRDEWLLAGDEAQVPISSTQTLVLWQEVIDREIFIGEPRVAEMASGSWRLLHEFRLKPPEQWAELYLNEDSRRFRDWAARFRELCDERGLVDEWTFTAALPGLIEQGRIDLPSAIHLTGFDLPMTPIQQAVIEAAEAAGTRVERGQVTAPDTRLAEVTAFVDNGEELRAAAVWARARLEDNPGQRIAVVVPDLRDRQAAAERIFRQAFDPPGFALSPAGHEPWHVSLGPPLARWSLVADALTLLRLDPHRISQPEAASILRSPFLAGSVDEHAARARALAELIARRPFWMHAGQIAWQAGKSSAGVFQQRLAEWEAQQREHRDAALPSAWVARFQKELKAIGFGHGRPLDSREYQLLNRWHELLEEFSALDLVIWRPIPRSEAVRRLVERAGAPAFRERNPGAPVEILGVEEALGSRFDAIWITTLDNQIWPAPARRDPLIPGPVQQDVPGATGDGSLARARLQLDGLLRTAPEVRGSFARGSDETPLELTPLLADCRIVEADTGATLETAALETLPDDTRAPALTGGKLGGGTGVLQRQSDCPFRAFAEWRLGAGDLTPPRPGLDARDRGSLVHKALEHFWRELDGLAALKALDENALENRIAAAGESALEEFAKRSPLALSEAGRELERTCLERSLRRWLALESERENFTVKALERKIELRFGDLALGGKIDRIDEIEGGGSVVIDYKTGASGRNGWAPDERLADVQLPAYALSMAPRPVAITFARLRPDMMGFDGLAEVDIGTPGVEVIGQIKGRSKFKEIESWPSLLGDWQQSLETLAGDFVSGRAEVDPREPRVCDYCHLHSFCRIYERTWMDNGTEKNA